MFIQARLLGTIGCVRMSLKSPDIAAPKLPPGVYWEDRPTNPTFGKDWLAMVIQRSKLTWLAGNSPMFE